MSESHKELLPLDMSDVDRRLGKPMGGAQIKEAIAVQDIRAWVQAMHNPNPLHYDEKFAAQTKFGQIVAPQSFDIACDQHHGVFPSTEGKIPGAHVLWGGAEWFFYGPRVVPGDRLICERVPFDYTIKETRFAGPTAFQRGETTYRNQKGAIVSKLRTTAVRYLLENAKRIGLRTAQQTEAQEMDWSDADRDRIEEEKQQYYRSFRQKPVRHGSEVSVGENLPRGVLGPHSLVTLTTDWRSYLWNRGFGASTHDDWHQDDPGFDSAVTVNLKRAELDPAQLDIIYYGPARGHLDPKFSRKIGMPRPYAFGASMNAWVIDYVANWAGHEGYITRCAYQARNPALVGDVTYLSGSVESVSQDENSPDRVKVTIQVTMTGSPAESVLGQARAEVTLPAR
jgi:acyl dehydratase